jgi:hypothetical protein
VLKLHNVLERHIIAVKSTYAGSSSSLQVPINCMLYSFNADFRIGIAGCPGM